MLIIGQFFWSLKYPSEESLAANSGISIQEISQLELELLDRALILKLICSRLTVGVMTI